MMEISLYANNDSLKSQGMNLIKTFVHEVNHARTSILTRKFGGDARQTYTHQGYNISLGSRLDELQSSLLEFYVEHGKHADIITKRLEMNRVNDLYKDKEAFPSNFDINSFVPDVRF